MVECRRLSMKTKRPITAEEQEFFDSMELNIRRKQVTLPPFLHATVLKTCLILLILLPSIASWLT